MRSIRTGVFILVVLAAAACGGGAENEASDGNSSASVPDSSTVTATPAEGGQASSVESATAIVTIGSERFDVEGDVACLTGDFISVTFVNSADRITITHTGDTTLIRMQLNAVDWVDDGSPGPPQYVDVGAKEVVSWTGTMSALSDGVSETVTMAIDCP